MIFEGKDVTVLLAGAGAGKTTRMLEYVAKELETHRPEEIAFVTYTRKGVQEGLSRVCREVGYDADDYPYFRTVHSLAYHMLEQHKGKVFDNKHESEFNKLYGYNTSRTRNSYSTGRKNALTGEIHETKDDKYLAMYDLERTGGLTTRRLAESFLDDGYYRSLVHDYEEYKASKCLVDFTDCLVRCAQEGDSLPCKVVCIDECQDLSPMQWRVIETVFKEAQKIYVAGDEKQCIHMHNGASPAQLIELAKVYPVEKLEVSYRIPLSVYRLADAVTCFISDKTELRLKPREENGEGSVRRLSSVRQLSGVIEYSPGKPVQPTWYLLVRNRCFQPRYMQMLEDALIPYWTEDGFFMGGEVLRRIKLYYKYGCPGHDGEQKRQFAEQYGITDFTAPFTDYPLFDDERKWVYMSYIEHYGLQVVLDMCKAPAQIYVGTVHSVKGGEADNVVLLLDMTARTSKGMFDDMDSELRCLYVAVTRAKKNLFLVDSKQKSGYDNIIDTLCDEFDLDFSA